MVEVPQPFPDFHLGLLTVFLDQVPPRGGNQMRNFNFLMIPKWILLSFQYIRMGEKEFLNLVTVLTLHIDPQNLKIPIIGSKKKVVVNPIYGYQNLSGEKYKSNGKRISSIGHTSEEKNPKNHPKMPFFWNLAFSDGFWIFLFTGMSDWANSFFVAFVFFSW